MDVVTYALLKKLSGSVDKKIEAISEGMTFKGSVQTEADLPSSATGGDLYIIEDTGTKAVWDGSKWLKFDNNVQIQALDKSVVVDGSKVGVALSKNKNNVLELKNDGLFVQHGEITPDDLAVKLPPALKKALQEQTDKNSGLIVDENNNIKVNVNDGHLIINNNVLDIQEGMLLQAIESN